MSRFAQVTIAAVELKDLSGLWVRADFIDAEALRGDTAAASQIALDHTVHTQWSARGKAGVRFGVRVAQLPVSKLDAVVEAIEAAIQNGEGFAVTGSDMNEVDLIDVLAMRDDQALGGKPYTRGSFSSGYVSDVTFRFISTGVNS